MIVTAMVLDFGLVRIDRQVNKSAADAAVVAGLNGLTNGDADAYPFRGVCLAMQYLQRNGDRFAQVTDTSGTWTTAATTPVGTANGCTDSTLRKQKCTPGAQSSWARFTWTGTFQGSPFKVVIQSGYNLATSGFQEESLPGAVNDQDDKAQGCDTLAVVITENRKPGLGSLAKSGDLVTTTRSVGRVKSSDTGDAPAMLLLKRTGCPILSTGSNGGSSYIHVYGAISSSGLAQPGTIHADSDGTSCGGTIFEGKAPNGIVAYAAPKVSAPTTPDPNKPGVITTVAGSNSVALAAIRDAAANVYSSAAINEAGAGTAAKNEPAGRAQVTRSIIDNRYLGLGTTPLSGVSAIVSNAQSSVFSKTVNSTATATAAGFPIYINSCSPTATDLASVTATSKVWINCNAAGGFDGTVPVIAKEVVFSGSVKPPNSGTVSLPNATKVYIFGDPGSNAIALGGGTLSIHASGNTASGKCSNAQSSTTTNKAVVVVKAGAIKQTSGTLQMCYTTMVNMGGNSTGCLPSTSGSAPTMTPCSSGMGDGQLSQNGGSVDWTAPNAYDQMTLPNGDPDPTKAPAWLDVNGPEDLAFWSESAGNNSSTTYNMNGQGVLHTVGVYMVPNADSFSIGGGATQDLTNAQYIATSIALNGNNTAITMKVDANSAVTLPKLKVVGLVR